MFKDVRFQEVLHQLKVNTASGNYSRTKEGKSVIKQEESLEAIDNNRGKPTIVASKNITRDNGLEGNLSTPDKDFSPAKKRDELTVNFAKGQRNEFIFRERGC